MNFFLAQMSIEESIQVLNLCSSCMFRFQVGAKPYCTREGTIME
ncbi:hypothetical protein V6Z11_A09G163600 [Gossypium hirsutum]